MHNYQRLQIYELSLEIAEIIYLLTQGLSRSDKWNIGQQMNRSALSVVPNIAEGAGRGDDRDFARFLRMARGSACELEAQTELGARLTLFEEGEIGRVRDMIEHVKASITVLERRLTSL